MNKDELIEIFDEYVVSNGKRASSNKAFKAVSQLSSYKIRLTDTPSSTVKTVAISMLSNQAYLSDILPPEKSAHYIDERNNFLHIIKTCNDIIKEEA